MAVQARELYARALFEAASSEAERETMLEELTSLWGVFEENPQYLRLMISPSLEKEKRRELLSQAFAGQVSPKMLNFLKVLADNRRFMEFRGILSEYSALLDEAQGILAVNAVTAMPLSKETEQKLVQKLEGQTGRKVRLTLKVDPAVLGGMLIQYEGKEIDGTVRTRLNAIRQSIASAAI